MFSPTEAEKFLKTNGYAILSKRPVEAVVTVVDGHDHYGNLEADYLVEKNGQQAIAVVHSGETVGDPNEPALRRKLLEVSRVFSRKSILLIDLNEGEIHRIKFRFPHEFNLENVFRFLIALVIVAGVVGFILVLAQLRLL